MGSVVTGYEVFDPLQNNIDCARGIRNHRYRAGMVEARRLGVGLATTLLRGVIIFVGIREYKMDPKIFLRFEKGGRPF